MITRRRALACSLAATLAAVRQAAGTDRTVELLFVHGRGQAGLDPASLKTAWMKALEEGAKSTNKPIPARVNVAFPFYGDVLESFVKQADLPLRPDVVSRGSQPNDDFLAFEADVVQSLRTKARITDDQILSEYGNNPQPRGPLNWAWVQAIIRAIDKHGGGLSGDAIEAFLRDVYLYTNVQTVRDAVDTIIRAQLTDKPTVVVAHSLGTVTAYNVLRTDSRILNIPLFLTVGSPLGIRAIRDQLAPLAFPAHVRAWYNAFDTRDVVVLFPLDKDNFPISPPVENYQGVRNQTDNRHGIGGYLSDTQVASEILGALDAPPA